MYLLYVNILIGMSPRDSPLKSSQSLFASIKKAFLHSNQDCTRAIMQHCLNGLTKSPAI
jgi:hypothetical protein